MARKRDISPDLWTDGRVLSLPWGGVCFYIGLISQADDDGRLEWDARELAARIVGIRDDVKLADIRKWMTAIAECELVRLYAVGRRTYAYHPAWARHQCVNRPKPSHLPAPPEHDSELEPSVIDHGLVSDPSVNHGAVSDESVTDHPSHAPGRAIAVAVAVADDSVTLDAAPARAREGVSDIDRVFETWKEATGKNGRTVLSPDRRKVIAAAVKSHGVETCLDAVRGWVNDPWAERPLHNDVTVLLRDAQHIEKFAGLWANGAPAMPAFDPMQARFEAIGRGN